MDQVFRDYRRYMLAVIIACALITTYVIYAAFRAVPAAQNRIYILSNNTTLTATVGGRRENLGVEARGHVRLFHEAFFTIDPDEQNIAEHKRTWLYLADGSAKKLDDSLNVAGYYANMVAGNISQRIHIDSVQFNPGNMNFRCYATLSIIRSTSTATRSLVTEGSLREVERSDHNLQGFLIQDWRILENKDLKVINH